MFEILKFCAPPPNPRLDLITNTRWGKLLSVSTYGKAHSMSATFGGDGALYMSGGWTGSAALSTMKSFTASNETWLTKASMPVALHRHRMVSVGNNIYVFGGRTGSTIDTSNRNIYVFSHSGNSWTTLSVKLPFDGIYICSAISGTNIFLYSTTNTGDAIPGVENFYVFNTLNNTFTKLPPSPFGPVALSSFAGNGEIKYMYGGNTVESGMAGTDIMRTFNTTTREWGSIVPRGVDKPGPAAFMPFGITYDNRFIVYSNSRISDTSETNQTWVYDTLFNQWGKQAQINPSGLTDGCNFRWNSILYFFGGYSRTGGYTVSDEAYKLNLTGI